MVLVISPDLDKSYVQLFDVAGLRTTEVAAILKVHRVTVSRWKSQGITCDIDVENRLTKLIELVSKAVTAKQLPLNSEFVAGKTARLIALKRILLHHMN